MQSLPSRIIPMRAVLLLLAVATVGLTGCGGGSSSSSSLPQAMASPPPPLAAAETIPFQWDDQLFAAIRLDKPGPTIVARSVAVMHAAMWDAWTAYDQTAIGTVVGTALRRPASEATGANKTKAISYAAYRAAVDLFPGHKSLFDAQMQLLGYDPNDVSADISTPQGIGNVAAAAVLNFRHQDGSNQLGGYADTTGYQPVNPPLDVADNGPFTAVDPSQWQQLTVVNPAGGTMTPKFTTPQWGLVTPFALTSGSQFRAPQPPAFGSPQYVAEAQEIMGYNGTLTDDQKVSAEYWADGPNSELPPGHWCLFAKYISQRDNHNLDDDVKLMFFLANAEFDTSIAIWETKRFYNTSRPITAIRKLFAGQMIQGFVGAGKPPAPIDAAHWLPYQQPNVVTPPFPEYVSGHSGFSAAGAEILRRWTGSDAFNYTTTIMPGTSKIEPGYAPVNPVTISLPTFTDGAVAAALSRRYGGIHFASGDLNGRAIGTKVADTVWDKAVTYLNGTASVPTGQAVVRHFARGR